MDNPTGELLEERKFAFRVDDKKLFEKVSKFQFEDPYNYVRELVQNAADAGPSKISVEIKPDRFYIEDDGEGMTKKDVDEYLLKIFSSNKKDDFTKIGKFGIGIVSTFAINPEKVIIETGRKDESWKVVINDDLSVDFYRGRRKKGTSITVIKKDKKSPLFAHHPERDKIHETCRYIKTPIYVNGRKINEEITLGDVLYETDINLQGMKGKVGIPRAKRRGMYLFKGGIFIVEKDNIGGYDRYVAIVDSWELNPVLSRNDVYADKAYDFVQKVVEDELFGLYAELLDDFPQKKDALREIVEGNLHERAHHFSSHILYDNLELDKFEEKLFKTKIFETTTGEEINLEDIAEQYKDEVKSRRSNNVYIAKNDVNLEYFADKKIVKYASSSSFEWQVLHEIFGDRVVDAHRELEYLEEKRMKEIREAEKRWREEERRKRRLEREMRWLERKDMIKTSMGNFFGKLGMAGHKFNVYLKPIGKDIKSGLLQSKRAFSNSINASGEKLAPPAKSICGPIFHGLKYGIKTGGKLLIAGLAVPASALMGLGGTVGDKIKQSYTVKHVPENELSDEEKFFCSRLGDDLDRFFIDDLFSTSKLDVERRMCEYRSGKVVGIIYGDCYLNRKNGLVKSMVKTVFGNPYEIHKFVPLLINEMTKEDETRFTKGYYTKDEKAARRKHLNKKKSEVVKYMAAGILEELNEDTIRGCAELYHQDPSTFGRRFELLPPVEKMEVVKHVYSLGQRDKEMEAWLESNYKSLVDAAGREIVGKTGYKKGGRQSKTDAGMTIEKVVREYFDYSNIRERYFPETYKLDYEPDRRKRSNKKKSEVVK